MSRQSLDSAKIIERQLSASRTRELAFLIESDKADRLSSIMRLLEALPPGRYLIGCGPYTSGVHRLGTQAIVIGRRPLPHEDRPEQEITIPVNDVPWFATREVSRLHASVFPSDDPNDETVFLRDESSTTGTYLNGRRIGCPDSSPLPNPTPVGHLDVIWLGPSGVNAYVLVLVS